MEMTSKWSRLPWYIDAWAVHDGRAFASRRTAESIAAEATVFLSVPDLEAVPVGRISTALRATRSGFQDGLRDPGGSEIAFRTLDQVRDLIRRAYLASGLGPGAPGVTAAPLPRPDLGPGPGVAYLNEEAIQDTEAPVNEQRVLGAFPPGLDNAVRRMAYATVLEWDGHLQRRDPEEVRGLLGWINQLARSGVFASESLPTRRATDGVPSSDEVISLARAYRADHVVDALNLVRDRAPYPLTSVLGESVGGYWSRLHLQVVPLPRLARWDRRMRRLVEMHTSALIDRRFWKAPRTTLDLAPL